MEKKNNIEIEIRGKLDRTNFDRVMTLLNKEAKSLDHYKRLSVDLSPGFDVKTKSWKSDDQIDLRVKKSGSSEKISLKIGDVHAKKRREIEVPLKEGGFLNSIYLLESLGFDKGMSYFWESWEFSYKQFEIKLSKYTENYYTWEIESTDGTDPLPLAQELELTPYTKDEYKKSIDWENQNIHRIYSRESLTNLIKGIT